MFFSPEIEKIERNLKYFETRLGYSPEQALALLVDQTSLLTCDIDNNIEPTLKFFEELLGPEDGLSLICSSPSILGGSLNKRFIPRRDRMIASGASFTKKTANHEVSHQRQFRWLDGLQRKRDS